MEHFLELYCGWNRVQTWYSIVEQFKDEKRREKAEIMERNNIEREKKEREKEKGIVKRQKCLISSGFLAENKQTLF